MGLRKGTAGGPGGGRNRADPRALLNFVTDRIHRLPLALVVVTTRCNSLCGSCDYRSGGVDLPADRARALGEALGRRGTRVLAVTGGEPLVRPDLGPLVDALSDGVPAARRLLLTNGLLLSRRVGDVAARFHEVVISLDGWDRASYARIRGVDGWGDLARGVAALRERAPEVPIRARCTVHRGNAASLVAIADAAGGLGLDSLSFLAADLASGAFGRSAAGRADPGLHLDADSRAGLAREIVLLAARAEAGDRFVAEDPRALRRIAARLDAAADGVPGPTPRCNAAWVSAVVEPDGAVRPCFFLPAYTDPGAGDPSPLAALDGPAAIAFRRVLDVREHPTCRACTCSRWMGPREAIGKKTQDLSVIRLTASKSPS